MNRMYTKHERNAGRFVKWQLSLLQLSCNDHSGYNLLVYVILFYTLWTLFSFNRI